MNTFSHWFRHLYQYRDTCRLIIRKIQYAPNELAAGPKSDISKQFMTADKPIHMEVSMDKEVQYFSVPVVDSFENFFFHQMQFCASLFTVVFSSF